VKAEAATEMEKRRQKLHEQQMKRREEQEQRRLALEAETNRKREAQKYVDQCTECKVRINYDHFNSLFR